MIDAKKFATTYNAFWQSAAPTIDLFVRRSNLDGYDRWDVPIDPPRDSNRRALLAEFAFSLFVARSNAGGVAVTAELESQAWDETIKKIAPYSEQGLDIATPLSKSEMDDVAKISDRLVLFFQPKAGLVIGRPEFPGCGYINRSEGDVIWGQAIYEVKTVDRSTRSSDLRQLLTYAALNKQAGTFEINAVGIFNPRRGLDAQFPLDELCHEVSGKTPTVLLGEIIEAISSGDISR